MGLPRPDGTISWRSVSAQPVLTPKQDLVGVVVSLFDLSERRIAAAGLAASEKRYRSLFEQMTQGVFLQNADGSLIDVNPAALSIFGLTRDEFLRRTSVTPDWDVIREDGSVFPGEEHPSMLALKTGKPVYGDVAGVFNPQRERRVWIEVNAIPEFHPGEDTPYRVMVTLHDITARIETLDALKASERKWRNILVNTPQIGISLDSRGKIVFVNNHFLKLTGRQREEVMGGDWFEMFIPEPNREEIRHVLEAVVCRKDVSGFSAYENEIVTRNGEHRLIAWSNVLTMDERGEFVDVTCLGIDLTERKRHEDELRKSEEKYRLLVDNQSDMVVKVDTEGRFLYVSPSYCQTIGKSEEELLGHSFMPLVHEDDRVPAAKAMEALYTPPHKAFMEQRSMTKDGWQWLAWADTAVLDEEGRVREIVGVGRNIHERKQMENEIIRIAAEWKTTFDSTQAAVWILDQNHVVVRSNETAELFFHKTNEQMIGRHCWEIVHGTDRAISECPALRARDSLKREVMELQLGENWYLVSADPILDSDGVYSGAVHTVSDINDRKRTEHFLEENRKWMAQELEVMKKLHYIGSLFVGEKSLQEVMQEIVETAVAIYRN